MKPPAPGSKAFQVQALRLQRAAGRRPNGTRDPGAKLRNDPVAFAKLMTFEDLKAKYIKSVTEALSSKPINAPVRASAPPQEKTTMKKSKTKAAAKPAKKRSVSEAASNLKAAKRKGTKTRAAKTDGAKEGDGGVRPGSKLELVANLLKRPEGCTSAEILAATGWPTCSVPQQAKAARLKLSKEKDGKVSRYRGTPLAA